MPAVVAWRFPLTMQILATLGHLRGRGASRRAAFAAVGHVTGPSSADLPGSVCLEIPAHDADPHDARASARARRIAPGRVCGRGARSGAEQCRFARQCLLDMLGDTFLYPALSQSQGRRPGVSPVIDAIEPARRIDLPRFSAIGMAE